MTDINKDSVETINTEIKEEAKKPVKKVTPKKKKVKTLKEKVCDILEIKENKDMNRSRGGVVKVYDMGNIESSLVVKYRGKTIRQFEFMKRNLVKAEKEKLREGLGEDYKYLTIEIRLFKPKFGNVGENKFKVGIYVYGPDFPRIIKRIGKNKNVKMID